LVDAGIVDQVVAVLTGGADSSSGAAVEAVGDGAAGIAIKVGGVEVVKIDADEAFAE
jgi:hypothetical protein